MRIFKYLLLCLAVCCALGLAGVVGILSYFSKDLPSLDAIKNYTPRLVTTVYSEDDKVVAEFSTQRRTIITPEEIPQNVSNAFVAAEDKEFFSHRGINPITILRAALKNLTAGQKVQGGSTITQQVAKSILLTPEKSYSRKIKEMLLAFKIEKVLSKKEILDLYLNHIFLGNEAYGIESAAQIYFGKHCKDLTVPEAAVIAGLPQAPSRYNPVKNPKEAKRRQTYVLGRMLDEGMITKAQYTEAIKTDLRVKTAGSIAEFSAPYFTENVRRYLIKKYGEDMLYNSGLKVYTTMNITAQTAAQDAINAGLVASDKRSGLRRSDKNFGTEDARRKWLAQEHVDLINKFYDYKLLNPQGELVDALEHKMPTPIEVGKNYQALVVSLDNKTKNIITQVGNRRGVIKPVDYHWAAEANPEEIYAQKVIRNPLKELRLGDLITIQPKALRTDPRKPELMDEFYLEQQPLVQGALISYRVPDGAMISMVGGYDFNITHSEFNRATQAVRQSGSAFKPFVYGAALESGLTASTILVDSPIVYKNNDEKTQMEKVWRPDNSTDKFYGDTTLRNALTYSRNIPTIKLLQHVGVAKVMDYAQRLGIDKTKLNADLSLALGSSGLTLVELMRGWGVFANQGRKLNTYFIRKIIDRDGQVLEEHTGLDDVDDSKPQTIAKDGSAKPTDKPIAKPNAGSPQSAPLANGQVIATGEAYVLTSLLQSVVELGTGTAVKALGRPVAGKTGTSNDFKDALFLGYIPQLFTGVWVGFDESRSIGRNEAGGKAAAPIWLQYMQVASAGIPVKDFDMPDDVVKVQIDAETGDVPTGATTKRVWEYYVKGTAPGQPAQEIGPDGKARVIANVVNKTKVVTGNSGSMPSSTPGGPAPIPTDNQGSDELIRDEL